MNPLTYNRIGSSQDALNALTAGSRLLAGGTDLLPLLKAGVQSVNAVADIKTAGLPADIEEYAKGISIGAMTTLADLEASALLAERYPLLIQAARETATVQIRNRATVGGNLLQRPRCWYFRNPRAHCWLKGGSDCLAVTGCNEHHAVFGKSPCRSVHPSDLAGCLLALQASVLLRSQRGERRQALEDFFAEPDSDRRRETHIAEDEVLISVDIPPRPQGYHDIYLKAMDRKVWAFALAGIAVVLHKTGDRVESARLVVNGLAPIPWRLRFSEDALTGTTGGRAAIADAVEALDANAHPLSNNAYKLALARRLLCRALETLLYP